MSDLAQMESEYIERLAPDANFLAEIPLFGGLDQNTRNYFSAKLQLIRLVPGQIVYEEGDTARELYIVVSGSCGVFKPGERGDDMLNTLKPRDFFGDMSFIDMQHRSATVRAQESTVLWRLTYGALREAYLHDTKSYTLVVMNIAREMSRRLRRADYQRKSFADMPVNKRNPASVIGRIGLRAMTNLRRKDSR